MSGQTSRLWAVVSAAVDEHTMLRQPRPGEQVGLADVLAGAERTAGQVVAELAGRVPDRLGILMGNGEPWVRGLFAALRLDATVVPLPLPVASGGAEAYLRHIQRVAQNAALDAVLVDGGFGRRTVAKVADALADTGRGSVPLLDVARPAEASPPAFAPHERAGTRPAVIQYTSGSTSAPKGVVLSTANVLASLATMAERIRLSRRDRVGLWLPLFHDMGLFSLLASFAVGASVCLWRPGDFVRDPMAWLAEFAASGCTGLPAPNFFFEYLVDSARRDGPPEGLDLSAWRFAIDGAEPVRAGTAEALWHTYARHGLRRNVVHPAYGLAEATLMVTFPELNTPVRHALIDRASLRPGERIRPVPAGAGGRAVVSCGRPVPGMMMRIADASGNPYPDGTVGEIQIRGPAVTAGYLDVAPDEQPYTRDGWLRTGDLAFLDGGQVYVVGRSKDVIVVRGQNYYAEDVEELVLTTPGIDRRVCAAFACDAGDGERMVVLWETRLVPAEAASLAADIRARISDQLGLGSTRIVPVPPSSIPHTTSGKVRRSAAARLYQHHQSPGATPRRYPREEGIRR